MTHIDADDIFGAQVCRGGCEDQVAPEPVLSYADAARLRAELAQKLASFGYVASRSAVDSVAEAVEDIVEPLFARHVAAERERREQVERQLAASDLCFKDRSQRYYAEVARAERADRLRDEARAEVERLRERIDVIEGDEITDLTVERDEWRAKYDALAAGVAALADEWVDDPLYADPDKADALRALLPDPSAALGAVKAEALREAADAMSGRLDTFPQRGRHTRARWAEAWLRDRADRIEGGEDQ